MNSFILLAGFLVFFVCLFLHMTIWRWRYPSNRPAALVLIFIILPFVFAAGYFGARGFVPGVVSIVSLPINYWLAIYLLHFALSTAYILSYPAVEAVSPSLIILLMIGSSKPPGLLYEDLAHCFDEGVLLQPRIKDLIEAKWIVESDGTFSATFRGVIILLFYMFLFRLLGMPKGKG